MRAVYFVYIIIAMIALGCNSNKRWHHEVEHLGDYPRILSKDGYLAFFFKSDVYVTRGEEDSIKPPAFTLNIPTDLQYWEINNSSNTSLFFSKRQVILIATPLYEPSFGESDTFYIPTKKILENFIDNQFHTPSKRKYDLSKSSPIPERKHAILNIGTTRIVLYNILSENFNEYLSFVRSFKILP